MRVQSHHDNGNHGVAPARQRAAQEASGEFVALLDADDVFLPERLQASVDTLSSHPAVQAVCSLGRNVE
jgi:glycosyltransferase involved in cell wall biosynthesis